MGAYFGMELNVMASMLYGQRAEPWHAGADIWGSASQQLLSTNGDLGAANAVLKTWPQSVGSASHAAFNGQVIGSQASLAEWATYTGSMSAALRLGGTALHAAQAIMPALQTGYDTAIALSSVPIIGPFAAQAAVAIQTAGAGMMEAVGGVMQAPRAVPPPAQGWQGPGHGNGAAPPPSPVPAVPATDVLDAADKLMGVLDKGATLAQNVMGLAESAGSAGMEGIGDTGLERLDVPGLAGENTAGAPMPGSGAIATPQHSGGASPGLLAGGGALGALAGAALRNGAGGGAGQLTGGIPGTRIGAGTEPALAGGTARNATAGAGRPTPAIAPPLGGGGGGGITDARQGGRPGTSAAVHKQSDEQEERLRRNGVQNGLQGRAAREQVERFGLAPARRRRRGGNGDPVLDDELFAAEPETARLDRP